MKVTDSLESPWVDIFIQDKWYCVDFDYDDKLTSFCEYSAIDETGNIRKLTKAEYNVVFYSVEEIRNFLIDEVIS
jgi:hypothetical protein